MPKGLLRSIGRATPQAQTIIKQVVPLVNVSVPVVAALGNDGFGGISVHKPVEGVILLLGAVARYSVDDQGSPLITDTYSPIVAVGISNSPAAGPSMGADNQTVFGPHVSNAGVAGVSSGNLAPSDSSKSGVTVNNSNNDVEFFLNILVDTGDIGNGSAPLLVNGEFIYLYTVFGDD